MLSGDPVSTVRELKGQPCLDIVLTGSITLAHTLLTAGLVDQLRLFGYPVLQGGGRRLFPDGFQGQLERLACTPFRSGITLQSYALG